MRDDLKDGMEFDFIQKMPGMSNLSRRQMKTTKIIFPETFIVFLDIPVFLKSLTFPKILQLWQPCHYIDNCYRVIEKEGKNKSYTIEKQMNKSMP